MNFSSSYDFAAEERKIGDLRSSVRTSAIPHINLDFSASHSFYNFDDSRRPLTRPRLVSASINTTVRGGFESGQGEGGADQGAFPAGKGTAGLGRPGGLRTTEFSGVGLEFALTHRYQINKGQTGTTKTQWLNFGLQLHPTERWSMSYDCQYDMQNKAIASQSLNIVRDMHCWEGTFTWIPSGRIAGYYIRINIKSLPDIKIEKSEGNVGPGF